MSRFPVFDRYILSLAETHEMDFDVVTEKLLDLTGLAGSTQLNAKMVANRYWQLKGEKPKKYNLCFPSSLREDSEVSHEDFFVLPERFKVVPEVWDDEVPDDAPKKDPYVRSRPNRLVLPTNTDESDSSEDTVQSTTTLSWKLQ